MSMARQIAVLQRLKVAELRGKYAEVFGESTRANNRDWLIRKIAWRVQSLAEGGLTERARRRAEELANDADLRVIPPREDGAEASPPRVLRVESDDRLPAPGTIISREYKGDTLQVKVLTDGFEFEGNVFKSLSAVAKAATGCHHNGYLFFKMPTKGGTR
jgi:hypothetical protein